MIKRISLIIVLAVTLAGCKTAAEWAADIANAATLVQNAEQKALVAAQKACRTIQQVSDEADALAEANLAGGTPGSRICRAQNNVARIAAGVSFQCGQILAATSQVPFSTLLRDVAAAVAAASQAKAQGC